MVAVTLMKMKFAMFARKAASESLGIPKEKSHWTLQRTRFLTADNFIQTFQWKSLVTVVVLYDFINFNT